MSSFRRWLRVLALPFVHRNDRASTTVYRLQGQMILSVSKPCAKFSSSAPDMVQAVKGKEHPAVVPTRSGRCMAPGIRTTGVVHRLDKSFGIPKPSLHRSVMKTYAARPAAPWDIRLADLSWHHWIARSGGILCKAVLPVHVDRPEHARLEALKLPCKSYSDWQGICAAASPNVHEICLERIKSSGR